MTETSSVAIVTGGAQGLGAAICIALLEQGNKVCVTDIQEEKRRHFVQELQEKFGSDNVIFNKCDVTKEDDYISSFESTLKAFGKVDILVNNAGIGIPTDLLLLIEVNLKGPIIGCETALKYMGTSNGGKGGIVINTASILGLVPWSLAPAYSATKHGVVGLTRSYGLPYFLKRNGVVFAAICPSFIDTDILKPMEKNKIPGLNVSQEPGLMSTEYVAKAVLKILEDRINGSTLVVTKKGYQYIGYENEFSDIPNLE